jgi:hypothetical protein
MDGLRSNFSKPVANGINCILKSTIFERFVYLLQSFRRFKRYLYFVACVDSHLDRPVRSEPLAIVLEVDLFIRLHPPPGDLDSQAVRHYVNDKLVICKERTDS